MDVSIILVNYNTKDLLSQCIKSIYEKTNGLRYEIIVSDNGSIDGTVPMLKQDFAEVVILDNNANLGFGKANNRAIEIAKGKYLFLLNTDTYLLNDAISIFWNFMEKPENSNVACCGGDLFDAIGNKQASFGNFPSFIDAISQLGFYRLYKKYYQRHITGGVFNYNEKIKQVDYICGADMFLRKSLMDNIGYFDDDFFLYFEETEMSYRIYKANYKSVLIPSAKIVHLEGGSQNTAVVNLFKTHEFSKSRRLYFEKTKGKFTAFLVKKVFVLQNLIYFALKRNKNYLKTAEIINKA